MSADDIVRSDRRFDDGLVLRIDLRRLREAPRRRNDWMNGWYWAHGRGYGDQLNDNNFFCIGIVQTDRNLHPSPWAVKGVMKLARVDADRFPTS